MEIQSVEIVENPLEIVEKWLPICHFQSMWWLVAYLSTTKSLWLSVQWASLVAQWRICLQCRRPRFHPWVRKIPWNRKWQPTPVFLPGESPWIKGPGRLQSIQSQRVGQDWMTNTFTSLWGVGLCRTHCEVSGLFCHHKVSSSSFLGW